MGVLRRLGGAATAGLLVGVLVGAPASAEAPLPYLGRASGRALVVSVGSLLAQASLGTSSAHVDATPRAGADSAGALGIALLDGSNAGTVEVSGNTTRQSTGEQCATPGLPAPLDALVGVGIACSDALAEVVDASPHGLGTAQVARLDVDAGALLEPITDVAEPILTELLGGTLDNINDTLPVGVPDLGVGDTLGSVLVALGATRALEVKLGSTTSEVTTKAGMVSSVATSQGGVISLLPLGVAGLRSVVEIEIGSAAATATFERASATTSTSFDPSVVTVRINTVTTDAVGRLVQVNPQEIKVGADLAAPVLGALGSPCADAVNEYCVLPGTPFETRISVASGRTLASPDGSAGATANAVRIVALRNIGPLLPPLDGGIVLDISQARAEVGGARPEVPRELPRTGGSQWLVIAGAAMLGLAVTGSRFLFRSHLPVDRC